MEWEIHNGNLEVKYNFRGKGGQIRSLRADELVISKTSEEKPEQGNFTVHCPIVIGRKAWRVDNEGVNVIKDLLKDLNNGNITSLSFLETLERKFEKA